MSDFFFYMFAVSLAYLTLAWYSERWIAREKEKIYKEWVAQLEATIEELKRK